MTGHKKSDFAAKKYVPNLGNMLHVCEVNYARLMRLLPDCNTEDLEYHFKVNDSLKYMLKIVECSRYTSTVEMSQQSNVVADFLRPVVQIRLYHDANLAEVITSQHIGSLQPSYGYPNIKMYQKNEKQMVNLFLAEWLQFCLKHSDHLSQSSV